MVISITNCLSFFFPTDTIFYQMTLSHTLRRGSNESTMKKFNCNQSYSFKKGLNKNIIMSSFKSSRDIQKKDGGPDSCFG